MGMFDEFGKVEVREEVKQEKSDLEKVLDIELEIIKQFEKDRRFYQFSQKEDEAYQLLYSVTQEKFAGITMTPEILQEYVDARANNSIDSESVIRGMYSAALYI